MGMCCGGPLNLVDPTGEIGILQALGIGVAIYFTVKTIYDGIQYLKKLLINLVSHYGVRNTISRF